ncbi:MAG: thiamine diphosphokinase [Alphaproteobacteria bacterium]|nr:thiamine diphosphokinase [Alphaproteobacteria bacterium]
MTYKSVLCLSGELPQKDFFEKMNLPVIAADGAANQLHALGIIPHIVIGDLDSVNPSLNLNSLHIQDQNRCDFEKSMEYLDEEGLLPSVILGSSGGDLDHILNNINIFMLNSQGNLLYAPPLYGAVFSTPQTQVILPNHTKISILGLPQARVVTQGLEWDLTGQKLYFPGFNSCLNRSKSTKVSIQVLEGQVLFLAHEFFLQK